VSAIPTGRYRPKPSKPGSVKLNISYAQDVSVHLVEPFEAPLSNFEGGCILLALDLHSVSGQALVLVDPPVSDRGNQRLLALHPDEARTLVQKLSQLLDDLDSERNQEVD